MNDAVKHVGVAAKAAKVACWTLAGLDGEVRDRALDEIHDVLRERREAILAENAADMADATALIERGEMTAPLRKRLDLAGDKFETLLQGIRDLRGLPDPVGRVDLATRLDDGLELFRVSCPIGVIGVIFESRPEAAVQIATLAIKSGNAVLLKGGREGKRSNAALVDAIRSGLGRAGVPEDVVQNLASREEVRAMLSQDEWIDLIIPRGSNELVRSIQENTRIPVLGHADGICTVYVDRAADTDRAVEIAADSKAEYPAVCNAAETLLIHGDAVARILPALGKRFAELGVELRADARAREVLPEAKAASEEDFDSEFLDLIMAVKVVDSLDEAIDHINRHGSHHTDAIVTEDPESAQRFLARVDSAGVYHNCSTRFADGFRYGFGAEVGVSTCKTHARGPVGLEGLLIYKYHLKGQGHCVADYGPSKRAFKHEPL